ncbi:MAG TPA: sulfatase-like hydrolase/transferase [Polyangiaceae bacterium]|nr:sulfatase-like hydrolase/transferase [Polyangiaceae bacterium]
MTKALSTPRLLVTSLLATWLALAAELAVVGAVRHRAFTAAWEFVVGAASLAPTALLLAVPAALFTALSYTLLRSRSRASTLAFGAVVGLLCGAIAWYVATGRHFDAPGRREAFSAIVGAVAALASYGAAPFASRAMAVAPGRTAALAGVAAVAVEVANRLILVRLYPAFHTGLAFFAVCKFTFGVLLLVALRPAPESRIRRLLPAVVAIAGLGVSAATLGAGARTLAGFDNFRLILVDDAPVLGEAVRAAGTIAPPPPLDEGACDGDPSRCEPAKGAAPADAGPSFLGRDLVLVSIDALRADHVGLYGYGRETTPNLDALGKEGVVFDQAYCATPHTSYSVTSLMTGKYMRPLLREGAGEDSDTLPMLLRHYGYRTAAFYPPAVFFIDQDRFRAFEETHFGFEYFKVEFLEGAARGAQVSDYVSALPPEQRLFLWVHLFSPHEPYEAHPEHPFGDRDVDRYDGEIASADDALGKIVSTVRARRPNAVVVVTADHGEEFGDHGGRYHGTTVFEEQVRVPLVVSAPGLLPAHRVKTVVQSIDLVPTFLDALGIPVSPRIRGRDLGPLLLADRGTPGFAFAETEEQALLAEGSHRLVCLRKLGACRLYDLAKDPAERDDLSAAEPELVSNLRKELATLGASHGRYERLGERPDGARAYPPAIRRAMAGDSDAAPDVAALLDDADPAIRRKAGELLFALRRPDTTAAIRLALGRDEDPEVRKWCALALTRLGEGAPLVVEMFRDGDPRWKRLAALALAETGDGRGEAVLVDWWQHGATDDYERALELLGAFTKIRAKDAVWPLVQSLHDVRLRPRIAETLAAIGDDTARGPLVAALAGERYQTARVAIGNALVALGAKEELARPLIRFLGVPDPIPGGVGMALSAKILDFVGGPDDRALRKMIQQSNIGVLVPLVVPKAGNGTGVRVIVRASARGRPGEVRVGRRGEPLQWNAKGELINDRKVPRIHDTDHVRLTIPDGPPVEVHAVLPASVGAAPGRSVELVVFAESHVTLEGLAVVPLDAELPPPPPEPWAKAN